jgi:type IV secretory pathway TrbL component
VTGYSFFIASFHGVRRIFHWNNTACIVFVILSNLFIPIVPMYFAYVGAMDVLEWGILRTLVVVGPFGLIASRFILGVVLRIIY